MSLSACTLSNEDGEFEFCFSICDDSGGGEPSGPKPPGTPIDFVFDGGTHQNANRLASDGVMQLRVEALPALIPTVSTASDVFALEVISAEPHLTMVELTALHPGIGRLTASIPGFSEPSNAFFAVAELSRINVAADFIQSVERLVVLPDIREVGLRMIAVDGNPVLDHSLVLDPSSDPGFTLTGWDLLGLPTTVGEHVVAITRKAGDVHHVPIRVTDRVDAIVADRVDTGDFAGDLCVHPELDGEVVATKVWKFRGANLELDANQVGPCVAFHAAVPGATITVEVAGFTADFVILPAE